MSEEGGGENVPIWIISFADMITLLLAFFVMLQALSSSQDMIYRGREASESFRRTIQGLGIPDLLWGKEFAKFDQLKPVYYADPDPIPDPADKRRILGDEAIRAAYADMEKAMTVQSTRLTEVTISKKMVLSAFEPGSATLTREGREAVESYVRAARDTRYNRSTRVYVIGVVAESEGLSASKAWGLASRRAAVVEQALEPLTVEMQRQGRWQVCSYGNVEATRWREVYGADVEKAQVLLAVTEAQRDGE